MKDLVGREMTPTERTLVRTYDRLLGLLGEADLAPCTAANVREAAAALYVALLDLGLRHERPDDHHL